MDVNWTKSEKWYKGVIEGMNREKERIKRDREKESSNARITC